MRGLAIALIIFLCTISVSACEKAEPPKQFSKTIVVLVDYSESVRNARGDYLDAFDKITSQIEVGTHFFVWKITELSEMEPKPLIDEDFPPPPPSPNEFYRKQAMAKAQKETEERSKDIKKRMQAFLESEEELTKRTAILGSLHVAERVFKKDKKDKRALVILSDMIEDSSEYNFEREKLSDRRITEIIARERNRKRLPDLKGANVYVAGARASTRKQFYHIQNFWLRYFRECGANLSKENYGSVLMSCDE
ncbi:MAG: hypothetical protein COX52_12805 [Syntrophobacterales bacterium CG23_combo_of_CG06-09_8_20_14_all_48_27]|nr:MAG: hypothetical protein COX52_12805 [Syntrophobacterales bacterium CG23_combo_of_CG06-09_8_20_14_all_48_27]